MRYPLDSGILLLKKWDQKIRPKTKPTFNFQSFSHEFAQSNFPWQMDQHKLRQQRKRINQYHANIDNGKINDTLEERFLTEPNKVRE